jgi:hypothetical protein
MNLNVEDLDRQLAGLTGRFAELGAKLSEAARELQDGGAPPPNTLVDQLGELRAQSVQFYGDVAAAAQAFGIAPPVDVHSVSSLEPVLKAIAGAVDAQRRQAALDQARKGVIEVLDIVLGVRHLDEERFPPLVDCQMEARDIHSLLMSLNETHLHQAKELTTRVRAFSDFLTLLEGSDKLDDERFAALEASVSNNFGRPLAVAAARGRLLRPGQTPPPPRPAPEPPRVAPAPSPAVAAAPVAEPVVAPPPVAEPVAAAAPVAPAPKPEPVIAPPPKPAAPSKPAPAVAPAARPAAAEPAKAKTPPAAAPAPAAAAAAGEASFDESAQWWLAAWARWSGWRGTKFPEAVKEELQKYAYLLSVPVHHSHEFEDGLLSYGYSILVDHVEQQKPGCVGNALNQLKANTGASVGQQLFDYLLTDGGLAETYPEFIKNVLLATLPEPAPWFDVRIVHTKDDTRIFRRPSERLGDTDQKPQRLLADKERFTEHKFSMRLPALTTRFVMLSAELKEAHGLEAAARVNGTPAEGGWIVTVPGSHRTSSKIDARPLAAEGTQVPAIGRDWTTVWVALVNAQPRTEAKYDLTLTLKKDSKGMKR